MVGLVIGSSLSFIGESWVGDSDASATPANLVAGPMQNLMGGFIANYGGQGFIDPTIQKIDSGV